MADYSPIYASGVLPFTRTTSAAVTGGRLVATTTTGVVGPAAAGALAIGVAAHDAASGAIVTVWPLANVEHEIEVLAAATVTVGDGVVSAAAGTINTAVIATAAAAGTLLGIATTTAAAPNKARFIGRG
jgi:hypothetical protein